MPNLSAAGNQFVQSLAQRHGVSIDAATHMLVAVHNGNGTMAQFNHPEFGGGGQWMQGGMTMVSDLFNHQLKSRVDSICCDIANQLAQHQLVPFSGSFQSQSQNGSSGQSQAAGVIGSTNSLFVPDPENNWWPNDLGSPSAVGSQNNVRYAYFPQSRRLAVRTGGEAWVYDTQDHQIGGFSQQQGVGGSITFTSQFGTVSLASLRVVSIGGVPQPQVAAAPAPITPPAPAGPPFQTPLQDNANSSTAPLQKQPVGEDIIDTLDRLGSLKEKGYITDEEFAAKKSDLLSRL
ncbi:MAG: SHOCT domain-containing protein [Pirellulaceae bacterium]